MYQRLTEKIPLFGEDPGPVYFSNAAATALLFAPSAAAWFGASVAPARSDARS